jgi:type VII secretion-associated serine protease mycosin
VTGLPHRRRHTAHRRSGATLLTVGALTLALLADRPVRLDPGAPTTPSVVAGGRPAAVPTAPAVGTMIRGHPVETRPVIMPLASDRVRDEQWHLRMFDVERLWRLSTGRGVTVAVVDSGVDGTHEDLSDRVLAGIDLVDDAGDGWSDPVGHGTTVAGLIAGRNDDAEGVVGLAPDARILPVRVLDEENRYDDAMIVARGVRWAVDNGAQVINLSLGGTGESPALAAALDYAFARDVVVVACTGNAGSAANDKVWYPAREPGVIAVTGTDRDRPEIWTGSVTGAETVLAAPATGLLGARPGGFWRVQGTSFAAPLVSATAALIRAQRPELSAADVVNRLISTARDLGEPGRDDVFGYGLLDPLAALTADPEPVSANPLDVNRVPPGVAGFGPAPGREPAATTPASRPTLQGAPFPTGRRTSWAPQPAGGPADQAPGWRGGLLLVLTVTTGTVWLVRRLSRRRPAAAGSPAWPKTRG